MDITNCISFIVIITRTFDSISQSHFIEPYFIYIFLIPQLSLLLLLPILADHPSLLDTCLSSIHGTKLVIDNHGSGMPSSLNSSDSGSGSGNSDEDSGALGLRIRIWSWGVALVGVGVGMSVL